MISKAKLKYIHSLAHKKTRAQTGVFVAEGSKLVEELLAVSTPSLVVATPQWLSVHSSLSALCECIAATDTELRQASFQQHPQEVIAVFRQWQHVVEPSVAQSQLCLALDGVQDPGNLGTIVRIADWFGITHVFCGKDTVDVYNPKVIQATMGSIARVKLTYCHLPHILQQLAPTTPVYGTFLNGTNIYNEPLSTCGLVVMGNEGKGISPLVSPYINRRLFIPPFPAEGSTAESLNVAVATAITCAEFRRRQL